MKPVTNLALSWFYIWQIDQCWSIIVEISFLWDWFRIGWKFRSWGFQSCWSWSCWSCGKWKLVHLLWTFIKDMKASAGGLFGVYTPWYSYSLASSVTITNLTKPFWLAKRASMHVIANENEKISVAGKEELHKEGSSSSKPGSGSSVVAHPNLDSFALIIALLYTLFYMI